MTNVQFLPSFKFSACKSEFFRKVSVESLPQYQELQDFIKHYQCQDIGYQYNNDCHDIIVITVNNNIISLKDLEQCLLQQSRRAITFFYVAINKFFVYSDFDCVTSNKDYDYKLIEFCANILNYNFNLVKYNYCNYDNGKLGNFMYPVTTMFFQRYE
jgi:hypothetical protein